jgi:hypothetical protein
MGAWTGHDDVVGAGVPTPAERAAPALDPVAALVAIFHRLLAALHAG